MGGWRVFTARGTSTEADVVGSLELGCDAKVAASVASFHHEGATCASGELDSDELGDVNDGKINSAADPSSTGCGLDAEDSTEPPNPQEAGVGCRTCFGLDRMCGCQGRGTTSAGGEEFSAERTQHNTSEPTLTRCQALRSEPPLLERARSVARARSVDPAARGRRLDARGASQQPRTSVDDSFDGNTVNPWANFNPRRLGGGIFSAVPRVSNSMVAQKMLPAAERMAVMSKEVVGPLVQAGGPHATFVDCTFGRGGHSEEILLHLSAQGRVTAFDMDPCTTASARLLERNDARFKFHRRPMGDLCNVVEEELGGVLVDLGAHSVAVDRVDTSDDGPLDLRLNPNSGMPASTWLQTVSVPELAWVIFTHGEDNDVVLAQRLAEAILCRQRKRGPYKSCVELADVCREVKQGVDDRGQHPAKLTFQAIRAFLNHEVEQLHLALRGAMQRLRHGCLCVVITYRRKEAAQVKRFLREHEEADARFATFVTPRRLAELYPLLTTDFPWACTLASEATKPSLAEMDSNPRSRPAVAHFLRKEARDPKLSPCLGVLPRPQKDQLKIPEPLPFFGSSRGQSV